MHQRMTEPIETPMDLFIEEMGLFAQDEGAPRIAGRMLGYLLVEGEPRSLSVMAEALAISKASASTNARLLERKGAVRRVSKPGQRGDAYEALEEPGLATIQNLAQRFRAKADRIDAIAATFPLTHDAARDRVTRHAEFNRKSADFIDEWGARLNRSCPEPAQMGHLARKD